MSIKSSKTIRKKITVLKSPHVNKTSQETFESKIYKKTLIIFSFQYYIIFMFIKRLQYSIFSDVEINIHSNINRSRLLKLINLFNLNNEKYGGLHILKKLDVEGECLLKINS